MRPALGLAAAIAVLALGGAVPPASAGPGGLIDALGVPFPKPALLDPGSITVQFRPGIDRTRSADVIQEAGCSLGYASRFTPGLMDIRIPAGADYRDYVKRFAARLDIEYAHPTYLDHPLFTPDDPYYSFQWHFPQIGMPTAWDILPSRGSSSVIVAVQDTGVAYENYSTFTKAPDLDGVTFVSPTDIWGVDAHPNDEDGHGTHVTGTIAQRTNNTQGVAGMADGVKIMPVRTLGPSGNTHTKFSDGVHWAVDHGANIINYSGGGSDSTEKHAAVQYAQTNGVLYIAAGGNGGLDSIGDPAFDYPGAYDEAIGVVATDYTKSRAPYSNYGSTADISAPGGDMSEDANSDGRADGVLQQTYTTSGSPTSGFSYLYYQGTSMATPHVTGLAALIWSQGKYTTAATVRSRIESTAEDLGTAGRDDDFGYGLIRADRALSPWLAWAGTTGYTADGVEPNGGKVATTTFTFKARYLDGTGATPAAAGCLIYKLVCGASGGTVWTLWRNLPMAKESGSIRNGAIYKVATTLPGNYTYRYRFRFRDSTNALVAGAPNSYLPGPKVKGVPRLCWTGQTGYTTDGVQPNSGSIGTKFTFRVLYSDSAGDAPVTHELRLERDGKLLTPIEMSPILKGSFREGRIYSTWVAINRAGTYRYRFVFADATGNAAGTPSTWQSGPSLGIVASASVTALTALPTNAGAQISFSLASAADVTATVTNVAGRPIRTLAQDRPLAAGLQTLLWDRRGESGVPVPAGLYLIRITAHDPNGAQSSALATLSVR